jgi:hypothetical protein
MSRIYAVRYRGNGTTSLVEANNRAQALRHVAEREYDVSLPDPKTAIGLSAAGIRVEQANVEAVQEAA